MSYIGLNRPQAIVDPNSLPSGSNFGKNILINANFNPEAVINQRGFAGGQPAAGVYGYDRWKGSAGGIGLTQIVEAGNFKPNTTYTLSGTNVTTQLLTSPASGNWQIDVPIDADLIQLELGSSPSNFEYVDKGVQLARCQRYYFRLTNHITVNTNYIANLQVYNSTTAFGKILTLPTTMRAIPTVAHSAVSNFRLHNSAGATLSVTGLTLLANDEHSIQCSSALIGTASLTGGHSTIFGTFIDGAWIEADAEL